MKPKRIILIRHGESQMDADRNLCSTIPDYKVELTERGWEQARAAGSDLSKLLGEEPIQCYVSPFRRAKQTLQGLRQGGLAVPDERIQEEVRLREQEWGHLRSPEENRRINEERDAYGSFYYRIPDGESGADVYDRVSTFLETLHRDFAKSDYPPNTLIVSHGLTIRLFLMRWFHWTVDYYVQLRNPRNCQHYVMELNPDTGKYALTCTMELHAEPRGGHHLP